MNKAFSLMAGTVLVLFLLTASGCGPWFWGDPHCPHHGHGGKHHCRHH